MKRVFLIVLDSVGAGALPDAAEYGDAGVSTLGRIAKSDKFCAENMIKLGLGNIEGLGFLGTADRPLAAYGRMAEVSKGKDTTIGHWEMAGVISEHPLPTYPEGFPPEIIERFSRETGRGVLCNRPYSGTEVIREYGEEHIKTGDLIVYTSADSVFQIAAHEEIVPVETLYEYCRIARDILCGEHGVGRVIARPFVGKPGSFERTANRHDFSLEPGGETMLDLIKAAGKEVISVGKIKDVFAGRGVTEALATTCNSEGMARTLELAGRDFDGLCFVNLVDFDMVYGHRQNVEGYAAAFAEFDRWLPDMLAALSPEDVLIITADHGCDPGDDSTDHTREYVPLLVYGERIAPVPLGTRACFADVAASVCEWLGVGYGGPGRSFAGGNARTAVKNIDRRALADMAAEAMKNSYAPYSGFNVGAALLASSGRVYLGCNIENSSYGATVCAERTALFKAVSEGERTFDAIAVVGGKNGDISEYCAPCGICRQALTEFCTPDTFEVVLGTRESLRSHTLAQLLPIGFGKDNLK